MPSSVWLFKDNGRSGISKLKEKIFVARNDLTDFGLLQTLKYTTLYNPATHVK